MINGKFIYQDNNCSKLINKDRRFSQSFLWKANDLPIYIMDNHRSALWGWLKHNKSINDRSIGLLHIDNHPDMSPTGLQCNCASKTNFENLGIEDYINLRHSPEERHEFNESSELLFSNQNFLSFFINNYSDIVDIYNFRITLPQHKKSSGHWQLLIDHLKDQRSAYLKNKYCFEPEHVAKKIDYKELTVLLNELRESKSKLIIDLDLDFFFQEMTGRVNYKLAHQVFILIKKLFDTNRVTTLTVAWSPEYLVKFENLKYQNGMYGWKKAKKLNDDFCKVFGISMNDFKLI